MIVPPSLPLPARRSRVRLLGVVLAAALAAAGAIAWTRVGAGPAAAAMRPPEASATALTVTVTTPERLVLPRRIAAQGSVQARDELRIGADAAGVRLVEVRVEVGARVRRGEVLARGDDRPLRAQLAQQEARVREAAAERAQADANLERAEQVRDSGLYSTEALETRRTAAAAAAARLALAEALRSELQLKVAQTVVLAPADGVIARRDALVGLVMQPGLELFRMIRDGRLDWQAELPDGALARLHAGAAAQLQLDDGGRVEGRVRLIAPTVDPQTRRGLVHVALPDGAPLRAGGLARGEIRVADAPMWTLPEGVVQMRDGEPFVYAVDDDAIARRVPVAVGERTQGRVEIIGGLAPGQRVVATGAGFVKDGERVRIAPSEAAGAAAGTAVTPGARS